MIDRARDLVIIAPERAAFQDVKHLLSAPEVSFEIHFNRRRGERRRGAQKGPGGGERRGRDRRALDVSEALQTTGWVLIPAAQRQGT